MKTSDSLKQLLKQTNQQQTPEFQIVKHHYTIIEELVQAGHTYTRISACLKADGYHISAKKIKTFYEQIKRENKGSKPKAKSSKTANQSRATSTPAQHSQPLPQQQNNSQTTQIAEYIDDHSAHEQPSAPPRSRKERMERLRQQQQQNPESVKPPPLVPIVDGELIEP